MSRGRPKQRSEDLLWATRPVEWPTSSRISKSTLVKLLKSSRTLSHNQSQKTAENVEGEGDGSYFSGFMNRVLNTSHTTDTEWVEAEASLESQGNQIPLRPPKCVGVSNGWIVAATELPITSSISLKLVSRWNVRRANTVSSSADHHLWLAVVAEMAHRHG